MVFASEKQENAPLLIEPAIVEATKIYRESVSTLSIAVSALLQMKTLTAKETESLWFFFAVTSHALCAVMPEYFLAVDDFGTHAEALAKGLRLLMYASNMAGSNATGGRLPLVNCAQHGKETQWLNFCVSSFETPSSLEVRRAAVLEEMIALFPEYAPLRLHYAVSLAMSHQLIGTDSVISLINSEREKLSTRAHIDPHHDSFLSLCKAFVLSTTNITSAAPNVTAVNATDLQTVAHEAVKRLEEIATCNSLFRPFASDGNSSWTAMFRNAGRPDVIDKWQAMKLLSTMKTLKQQFPVGEEISDALPEGFANCSG
ncbi:unnamed protein product [Trypanosoma congolense IL3000]|uniref:WGS project CAEQ00000000 data, annotated contig 396 n=1 Tax=Trypanosoma congolense (strain IL3000) TaxID=1068625 RepID=F9WFK0_TRYCI|nr:unnamed protein product [Trypanosoma congolense IL3000]